MRDAKVTDIWRKFGKKNDYKKYIEYLSLNGLNEIGDIEFSQGITVLCGLNGVGKSSILLSLKELAGLNKKESDSHKVKDSKTEIMLKLNNELEVFTTEDSRCDSINEYKNSIWSIDYKLSHENIEFFFQDNLDELLLQYEESILNQEDTELLSYLVGKKYNEIKLTVIEDDGEIYPYFSVAIGENNYSSVDMGIGEHWIFYIWWRIYSSDSNVIGLIEEPETFISITSQRRIMNFLAESSVKKNISFVITTHSPFIVEKVSENKIRLISRYNDTVSIIKGDDNLDYMKALGLSMKKEKGVLFVEDELALVLLKTILKSYSKELLELYSMEYLDGHGDINKSLKNLKNLYSKKMNYKFVGLYDGDMREDYGSWGGDGWRFDYLPSKKPFENVAIDIISNQKNREIILKEFNIKKNEFIVILENLNGQDYHDWVNKFVKLTNSSLDKVVEKVFNIWIEDTEAKNEVEDFVKMIQQI